MIIMKTRLKLIIEAGKEHFYYMRDVCSRSFTPIGEHSLEEVYVGAFQAGADWQSKQSDWCLDMSKAPHGDMVAAHDGYGLFGDELLLLFKDGLGGKSYWSCVGSWFVHNESNFSGWIDTYEGEDLPTPIAWKHIEYPQYPQTNNDVGEL